ncbi:MAG: RBBP9/YdeN family alpha/beta hydrolase [Hyphomicrobiaceae bacterium]
MDSTLIVPGLHGSGADHWQTWFQQKLPHSVRVIQRDWQDPYLPHWSARVRRELNRVPGRIWVVAHSFGCLAAAQAAFDYGDHISGLMLVAPADPDKFGAATYLPERPLGVPAVLVASTNDPWMRFDRAVDWADTWGAELINLGPAGHINTQSGFGPWPQGLSILRELRRDATAWSEQHTNDERYLQLGEL